MISRKGAKTQRVREIATSTPAASPRNDEVDVVDEVRGAVDVRFPRERLLVREVSTPGLVTRGFSLRAATVDERARTVEAVISTESPATVYDFRTYEFVEEVLIAGGMRSAESLPLLDSHNQWSTDAVMGSVRDIRKESGRVVARLHFIEGDADVDRVWNKVRQGALTDVSVGYVIDDESVVRIGPNETATIDGKQFKAGKRGLRVAREWTVREVSVVPVGADEFAKLRGEGRGGRGGRGEMKAMKFSKGTMRYLRAIGLGQDAQATEAQEFYDSLTGGERALADAIQSGAVRGQQLERAISTATGETRGDETATSTSATSPRSDDGGERGDEETEERAEGEMEDEEEDDSEAERSASLVTRRVLRERASDGDITARVQSEIANARQLERARAREIRRLGSGLDEELVTRAIEEDWTVERASRAFLTAMRDGRAAPASFAVHSRSHERDCTLRALQAGMFLRLGVPEKYLSAHSRNDAHLPWAVPASEAARALESGQRYADMNSVDLCREACRLDNVNAPHNRQDLIRTAVSGGSLANIFSTSINARLLASYMEAPDTTVGFVRVNTDVSNFMTQERTQLGKTANLEKLARGGTANDATIGAKKEEYKIARYAKKFTVDEQDLIDDQLGAIMQKPMEMGMAAKRLRPDLVYSILLDNALLGADGIALFDASDHANLASAVGVFSAETIQLGISAMAKQTQDGVNLNIRAAHLIVPVDLDFAARIALASSERVISSGSGGTLNPLRDLNIQLHVDNRIGVAGVTDPSTGTAHVGTAANWFLAADPMAAPTIEVGYLRGGGGNPIMRSYKLDQGAFGIGWDVHLDIGAKALDYRGLYMDAGTAEGG